MISLREFAYEIRQRIDAGRTTEAIPLAQYLLRRHPRYLRGYQLLAEAALEQGNPADAIEIFSRVLSADPESFAAHAGLASAYTDQNELDNALWHMTRAFESEPGMKAVRDQLRYLYELRDGRAPGRLHLNPAALARSYLRNGAYDVAVEEITHELSSDPDRIDLRVALAEAYWFANQPQESARIAFQILEELPLALKPHLILGAFYYQAEEMEQAETHLRIAQELDPENDTAISIFGEGTPFRAIAIPIDEPDNIARGTAPLGGMQLPEWLRDLSLFMAPEAPTEGMDWDAIIAYEDDWRTQLAGATREALTAYKPNWRANLRVATIRALRDKGMLYPTAASAPETQPDRPGVAEPLADWRESLYEESVSTFVERPAEGLGVSREWEQDEPVTEPIRTIAPEWHAALRFATEEALASYKSAQGRETIEWTPGPTVELPELPFTPVHESDWVYGLRESTEAVIAPAEAQSGVTELKTTSAVAEPVALVETADSPVVHRQRLVGRWIPTLRVSTEIWLAMQRRSDRRGTSTLTPPDESEMPIAAQPTYESGITPLEAAVEAEETVTPLMTDWVEPTPSGEEWVEPVADAFTLEPVELHGSVPASEEMEADALEFSGVTEPSDLPFDVVEPDTEPVTMEPEVAPVEAVMHTPLQEAQHLWQGGEVKEAVGRYQMLFYEEAVPDDDLSAALAEWVSTDTAPALIYQLLGDVYRRMGRMQEAVAHYREAINRM